jgi:iron-regulated transporter 1
MWDMGIVLLIAELSNNSLFLIALSGFVSSFLMLFLMPIIGTWLDYSDRLTAIQILLSIKMTAITISYGACAYLSVYSSSSSLQTLLLYSIPLLCGIANIAFCTITQSIEKDWIVVISGNNSDWLSNANSIMSQIDLGFLFSLPITLFYKLINNFQLKIILLIII